MSISEFMESDEFCDRPLFPRQRALLKIVFLEELNGYEEDVLSQWERGEGNVTISPMMRERIQICRNEGRPHFATTMFCAGRRSSKGHMTGGVIAKKIYDLRQIQDPGKHYGIASDKDIYLNAIAVALEQAKGAQFADILGTVTACKALQPHINRVLEELLTIYTPADEQFVASFKARNKNGIARDVAKIRSRPLAANARTVRGYAMIAAVFDEFAHMQTGESASSADECLEAIRPSLAQFRKDAILMMNSSPYTKDSRFYKEFQLLMALEGPMPLNTSGFAIKFPSWEMYRDYERERTFRHAIMVSPDWDTETLNHDERLQQDQERVEEQGDPESYKVEKRAEWAEVLDGYMNADVVDRAFREYLPEFGIKVSAKKGGVSQNQPYMAAIDASSTTAGFGFSVGHGETFESQGRVEGFAKHVIFDFVKRWDPATFPSKTIDYPVVIDEIVQYCVMFRPTILQMDQFGSGPVSGYLKQQLRNAGVYETEVKIEAGAQHRNWDKWEAFKTALNHGFVHFPLDCDSATGEAGGDSAQLRKELKQLQVKRTGQVPKVDKPPTSLARKDMSDTCRDVSWLLIGEQMQRFASPEQLAAPLSMGAQGGFQVGGRNPGGPVQDGGGATVNQAMNEWYSQRGNGNFGGPSRGFGGRGRR